jgi:sugar O-acyltransferase (sialic acid O-acetyltransferase NeuD family)
MKKLLIWGKGGHSKVIQDCLNSWRGITLIDNSTKDSDNDEWLTTSYPTKKYEVFIAIGDNKVREIITLRLLNLGYQLSTIKSKSSIVSKWARLERGVFIAPGACVNTNTDIGLGTIVNTTASVDHDCQIKSFTHIAPGCHICGGVRIGSNTLIGVGTSIIPRMTIGNNIIVAGGSSVNKNLDNNGLYAGNPVQWKKEIS